MDNFQKEVCNELKKIIKEDLPKNLNDKQKLKLEQIKKELSKNEYKS